MSQVQAGVIEKTGSVMPQSAVGVAVMNGLMSLAALFGIDFFGRYILKENVKGWSLPEYAALKV